MRFNDRRMALLEIPDLPDHAFKRKADGGIIPQGGGGGGQTAQTTQQTDIPSWVKPYAQDTLAKASALTDINKNPYQTYGGERIAGFSPMEEQAFTGAANLGPSQAGLAGQGVALGASLGAMDTGRFGGRQAQRYMNPYLQASLAPQMELMRQQQGAQAAQMAGQATQAGAFGGSRFGLAQAQQNLNNQLAQQNLVGQGYNTAYQQAMAQYNADQARRLQGMQTALQGAQALGSLGQQEFGQQQQAINVQNQLGGQQRALEQQGLDVAYQNFINQQNYPYRQLGFMSDIIRGTPMGSSSITNQYQSPGSTLGQLAGLGTGLAALASKKEGGEIKSYSGREGSVTSQGFKESKLEDIRYDERALLAARKAALARNDKETVDYIDQLMAQDRSIHSGLGYAFNQLPQQSQEDVIQAASGGMVAFAGDDKSDVKEKSDSEGGVSSLAYLATMFPAIKQAISSALPAAKSAAPYAKDALKALGTTARSAGAAYMNPVSGVVGGGGLYLSESAARALQNASPEQLDQLAEAGADPSGTSLAAAIMAESKRNEAKPRKPTRSSVADSDEALEGELAGFDEATARFMQEREGASAGKPEAPSKAPRATTAAKDISAAAPPSSRGPATSISEAAKTKFDMAKSVSDARELMKDPEVTKLLQENADEIKRYAARAETAKQMATRQALADFGFRWAQEASKPGARFIGSAAAASPAISESLKKSDELEQRMAENAMRMRQLHNQSIISMRKGDTQAAIQYAGQERMYEQSQQQLALQHQQLQELIRYHKASEAHQGAMLGVEREKLARPGETERMVEKLRNIRAGKESIDGKTGEESAQAYAEDVGKIRAAMLGTRYSQDKTAERLTNILRGDDEYKLLKVQRVGLASKADLNDKQRAALSRIDARIAEIESAAKQRAGVSAPSMGSGTPPPAAIQALMQNPDLRAQFDAKYGRGAADQYLGE